MTDADDSSSPSQGRREDGFAAVFTVIVLFALLAIAALALDLGGLRAQRETNRGISDLAAAAGALSLSNSSSMTTACTEAFNYTVTNLGRASSVGSLDCSPFATTCSPTTARRASATVGAYTITIINPVPDTDALMGSHTIGGVTQPLNASIDGSACNRIGVQIVYQRFSVFAQVLGTRSSTTTTSSVALASTGTSKGAAPALLILEPSACNALLASGQGNVEAQNNGDTPGFIAVDSSGTGGSGSTNCSTGGRYTLDASGTQNSSIIADSGTSGTPGVIDLYALAPGQGNSAAYDPTDLPARVSPTPIAESTRVTRAPADWRYNCTAAGQDGIVGTSDDCKTATGTSDYITQLHRLYDTTSPYNAPTVPSGFTTYPRTGVSGDSCSPNGAAITLPAGNWYINCPSGFSVSNTFTIGGGNVVFAGGINVQGNSLTINPTGSPTTIVYVRSGDIAKGAQASLTFKQTAVVLQNGVLSLGGGGAGALNWYAPSDPLSPYYGLALWSESANAHSMAGAATLNLQGVFFMPNAGFSFSGQGGQYQTSAQFVSKTLTMSGQGTLHIRPDPSSALYIPSVGERLIR